MDIRKNDQCPSAFLNQTDFEAVTFPVCGDHPLRFCDCHIFRKYTLPLHKMAEDRHFLEGSDSVPVVDAAIGLGWLSLRI